MAGTGPGHDKSLCRLHLRMMKFHVTFALTLVTDLVTVLNLAQSDAVRQA
jgi:hypothetical protein